MKPTIRVKLGLLAITSLILTTLSWSTAQGQLRPPGMRGPIGPRIRRPGMPIGGQTTTVWKCPSCGFEYRGAIPPSTCPGCQSRMSNGVGNGIRGPRGMTNPNPGMNRGFNPPVMPPPVVNPNPPVSPLPPVNPNPPVSPMPPVNNDLKPVGEIVPAADSSASTSSNSSAGESKSSSRKWVLPVVIGIIVLGIFVLLGGTFLVIYTMHNRGSAPSKRRRRRRDDDD